jgi:hypothetical protein
MLDLSSQGPTMNHEAALIELAAAVARLSDSVEATARLLNSLCERLGEPQADALVVPAPAAESNTSLRVIQGGRTGTALVVVPPPD